MDDLIAFLNARLAEVERDAPSGPRHTPGVSPLALSRVLTEVDAKRRVIRACVGAVERKKIHDGWRDIQTEYPLAVHALQLLCLPYADHPDYQAEWSP